MSTLLIACGNSLRRDDGAAHEVLRLVAPAPDRVVRAVPQLTPELAEEVSRFDRVVFIDADVESNGLAIEPLGAAASPSPLTHASAPAGIVALARALFGFAGEALLCRIPARDFSPGGELTPYTMRMAREAAIRIANLI